MVIVIVRRCRVVAELAVTVVGFVTFCHVHRIEMVRSLWRRGGKFAGQYPSPAGVSQRKAWQAANKGCYYPYRSVRSTRPEFNRQYYLTA